MSLNSPILMLAFVAIAAAALLLQALVLLGIFLAVRRSERAATEKIDALRNDIAPVLRTAQGLLDNAQSLLRHIDPRARAIADNIYAASEAVRDQANNTNMALAEVTERTLQQVRRVDGMVTDVLDAVAHGTRLVRDTILPPLRQVGGWLHAIQAVLDTLRHPSRRSARQNDRDLA